MSTKPQVSTAGGGQATPTANAWNQFLLQGLQSGNFGGGGGGQSWPGGNNPLPAGTPNPFGGGNNPASNPVTQSIGQTSGFGGAINSLLSGQPNSNPYLTQLNQQLGQNYNPTAQLPNAPTFQGTGPAAQGTAGNANLVNSGVGQASQVNAQQQTAGLTQAGGPNAFSTMFGAGGQGNNGINPINTQGQSGDFGYKPGSLLNYDINAPQFKAFNELNQRQTASDVANQRARFSLTGNSLGSGASLAEAQLRAEANPRNILAMGQLGRSMQEMDLNQQGLNNQQRGTMGGLQLSDAMQRMGFGIGQNANNQNFALGRMGQQLGALGLDQNQSQFNAGAANQMGQFNAGQGNALNQFNAGQANNMSQWNTGQANINGWNNAAAANNMNQFNTGQNNAMSQFNTGQANNMNQFNTGQANQFGLNLFGQQSNNALQNQGMSNQWQSGLNSLLANTGLNYAQLAQSGQLGILGQLFGSMNQANALGTPQANTVVAPSQFSQITSGIGGILGGIGNLGNPFSNGGQAGGGGGFPGATIPQAQPGGYFGGPRPPTGWTGSQGFSPNIGMIQGGGSGMVNQVPGSGGFNPQMMEGQATPGQAPQIPNDPRNFIPKFQGGWSGNPFWS